MKTGRSFDIERPLQPYTQSQRDVTFVVGKDCKEIYASQLQLERLSPVFQKTFSEQKTFRKCVVVPTEYEVESIQAIVAFSLGLKPKITAKNLLNVRAVAIHYGVGSLQRILDAKLTKTMKNEQHFCWVLHSACVQMDQTLVSMCLHVFETELDHSKVFSSDFFLCLDFEPDLWLLLRIPRLRIDANELSRRLVVWASCKGVPFESLELLKTLTLQDQNHCDNEKENHHPQNPGEDCVSFGDEDLENPEDVFVDCDCLCLDSFQLVTKRLFSPN